MPEIGAQFGSFNFPNRLICVARSSAPARSGRYRLIVTRWTIFETVELSVPAKGSLRQVHLSKRTRRPAADASAVGQADLPSSN
jgi:hypothetical protein